MSDEKLQSVTVSPLGHHELEAMRLKFEGYTYPQIAEKLDNLYKWESIRNWFARGGKLHEFYKAYAKTEAESRRQIAVDLYKAHLDKAVATLFHLMQHSKLDIVRLAAAKEIINRELGEPKKVIQTETSNPARDIIDEIKKRADERERTT